MVMTGFIIERTIQTIDFFFFRLMSCLVYISASQYCIITSNVEIIINYCILKIVSEWKLVCDSVQFKRSFLKLYSSTY